MGSHEIWSDSSAHFDWLCVWHFADIERGKANHGSFGCCSESGFLWTSALWGRVLRTTKQRIGGGKGEAKWITKAFQSSKAKICDNPRFEAAQRPKLGSPKF